MTRKGLVGAFLAALLLGSTPAASASEPAQPVQSFQLVRSLQRVQDRIASGDHAVLPMQRKALERADRALREADDAELAEPRNFRAVLIYAMSGGNPATVEILLPRLIGAARGRAKAEEDAKRAAAEESGEAPPEPAAEEAHGGGHAAKPGMKDNAAPPKPVRSADERLALGVYNYLRGRPEDAREALSAIDPMAEEPELGAFLALVRGQLEASNTPQVAARLLDQARLLGTGTLVEEAATRRAVLLAVELGERPRFIALSESYARRFVLSPYAAQWADGFVAGVMALREGLDFADLDRVTENLDPERRRVLFLRIARAAGIEQATALADFASARAEAEPGRDDPRTVLYSALPKVATEGSDEVLRSLRTIDQTKLTTSDRALLQAAKAVAEGLKLPDTTPAALPEPTAEPQTADLDPAVTESEAKLTGARKALGDIDALLGKSR